MDLYQVDRIIGKIADGFEEACKECMAENSEVFTRIVREQLFSGLDGEGRELQPSYLDDPYFDNVNWFHWDEMTTKIYHGAEGYLQWKKDITPPTTGQVIGYPARNEGTPNLYIDGTFYGTIEARATNDGVQVYTDSETGMKIEQKYGATIFAIADLGKSWFNERYMLPAIARFFKDCGYR